MQPQQHWTKGDNNFFWSVSHSNVGEYAVCLLHAVGTLFIHIQFDLKYFSAGLLTHQSVPTCTAAWGYSAWGIQVCISPSWATCGFQRPNWPVVVHMLRQRYVKKKPKQNQTSRTHKPLQFFFLMHISKHLAKISFGVHTKDLWYRQSSRPGNVAVWSACSPASGSST